MVLDLNGCSAVTAVHLIYVQQTQSQYSTYYVVLYKFEFK